MGIKNKLLFTFLFLGMIQTISSQTIKKDNVGEEQRANPLFNGAIIALGQSVETRLKGTLAISGANRFWNTGAEQSQSFAADRWNSRIGAEYAVSDRFAIGMGYGTGYRSLDVFGKYRLFYRKGSNNNPFFNITLFQGGTYREKSSLEGFTDDIGFSDKLAFTTQLLIAKEITENLSLQISPTYIYRAEDALTNDSDSGHFAFGIGGRYRISDRVSLVSEYYHTMNPVNYIDTFGAFALGANWKVSDLLLQFELTNAGNLVEDKFIVKTIRNFNFRDGNLHFGFRATYFVQL